MTIKIYEARLSFFWVNALFDLLTEPAPIDAPLAFLGRSYTYGPEFERILSASSEAESLSLPWHVPGKQFFWTYYLEGKTLGRISGKAAWKALVPLRGDVPLAVKVSGWPGDLSLEACYYPHGVSLVVTARLRTAMTLAEMVDHCFELKRKRHFQLHEIEEDETREKISVSTLVDKIFPALERVMLSVAPSQQVARMVQPFSIVTVVQAEGVDVDQPLPRGGEIHRVLEALTAWRPTWQNDALPPLAEATLKTRTAPPGHILYGRETGRVVWFPGLFSQKPKPDVRMTSLGCYHRNLLFASMQVASLANLIQETMKQIRNGSSIPVAQRECAKHAAGLLGRLYGGDRSTYRSWSIKAQIEQNDLLTDINEMRDFFDMVPLT